MINLNAFSIQLKSDKKRAAFRRLVRLIVEVKQSEDLQGILPYFFKEKDNWLLVGEAVFDDFLVALKNSQVCGDEGLLFAFTNNAFFNFVKTTNKGYALDPSFVVSPAFEWLPKLVEKMNEFKAASKGATLTPLVSSECVIANVSTLNLSADKLFSLYQKYTTEVAQGVTLVPFGGYLQNISIENGRKAHSPHVATK